jgi:hypothetical protein
VSGEPGLDWLLTDFPGVVIVVMKRIPGEPPESKERAWKPLQAAAEKLQDVLDKAAKQFHDPTRPDSPPLTAELVSRLLSTYPPPSSPPTRTRNRGR